MYMKHSTKLNRRTEIQIRALLSLQEKQDIPVIAFCKTHKIHKATLYNWRNKYSANPAGRQEFVLAIDRLIGDAEQAHAKLSPASSDANRLGARTAVDAGVLQVRISANVTDDFGNVTGLSGRC